MGEHQTPSDSLEYGTHFPQPLAPPTSLSCLKTQGVNVEAAQSNAS